MKADNSIKTAMNAILLLALSLSETQREPASFFVHGTDPDFR
jgi:hypothetical protein